MRHWRVGILRALVHRVLKDGNFDIPAKKKTDKTHLSLTTVKPDLYNYFQSNMDRVLLIMTERN